MSETTDIRELGRYDGGTATVHGWVHTTRTHGKVAFVVVRDGTAVVQCVVGQRDVRPEVWEEVHRLTQETSVRVEGKVRADARAPGGYELSVTELEVLGRSEEYPIQPKEHGVDFLLDHRHLWLRSGQQRAIMRVRSEVEQAIHDFFYERGFTRIDTPILTGAIGEGGAGLFEVEYFEQQAYLAQTGQLYAEAAAAALGRVYCFGPTFRAEKSKTRRHLTEFWMIEPEVAWNDSAANMRLQEDFVSYVVGRCLERRKTDLAELGRDLAPLQRVVPPFHRISYTDAVAKLQELGADMEWGRDLGGDDETLLAKQYDRPVFVYNYPK